jgi:hypothetical protein
MLVQLQPLKGSGDSISLRRETGHTAPVGGCRCQASECKGEKAVSVSQTWQSRRASD